LTGTVSDMQDLCVSMGKRQILVNIYYLAE
jgi:hypothetical protein